MDNGQKIMVCLLLCLLGLVCISDVYAQRDRISILRRSVEEYPLDDSAWQRLGIALFERGDLDAAQTAFQKALKIKKTASAYTGLGQVYGARGKGATQKAFQTLRMALGVEENYAPAQLEIARLHTKLRDHDAEAAYRRAIEMDPTFAPAYRELILWYEKGQLDWEKELVELCQTYITRWPDDAMGYYHLALIYVDRNLYDKVYRLAERAAQRFSDDLSWIPMMAQAEAARGNPGRALILFEQFLGSAPDNERVHYEDLSLLATKLELKALEAVPDSLRDTAHTRFWRTRSGAAMLGADARRVEHYRRVWYARTYFGRHQKPWDKRGEVYVRYGEPNYRSRSGRENEIPSVAVQQFKLHKIDQIAELQGEKHDDRELPVMYPGSTYFIGQSQDYPVGPDDADVAVWQPTWLWEVQTPGGMLRLNLPLGMQQGIEPAALIDRDPSGNTLMPWESWVYLDIGNGIEFTFTDRFMSGQWDFPLVPATLQNLQLVVEVNNTQPAVEFMQTASAIPEKFTVPPGVVPLDFYYDLASFRSTSGQPELEVYFGIPPDQIQSERTGEFMRLKLAHDLILVNEMGEAVYHTADARVFQARVGVDKQEGLFVDIARLSAAPGTYTLGVKLVDQLSGKWNLYQQEVVIPSFADSLAISDLELAWVVSETPQAKKFKKGDVWVVPEPTRKYGSNDVHLYYEIYNLTRDTFGQVKYRVDYTIRENIQNSVGVVGVLAGSLKRFFQSHQKPEFRVGYEQAGTEVDEPVFFELETEKLKPGLKEVVVTITDLNVQKTVSQEAVFWIGVLAK